MDAEFLVWTSSSFNVMNHAYDLAVNDAELDIWSHYGYSYDPFGSKQSFLFRNGAVVAVGKANHVITK